MWSDCIVICPCLLPQLPIKVGHQNTHTKVSTEHNKECLINISKYKFSLVISGLTTILKNVNNMVSAESGQTQQLYYGCCHVVAYDPFLCPLIYWECFIELGFEKFSNQYNTFGFLSSSFIVFCFVFFTIMTLPLHVGYKATHFPLHFPHIKQTSSRHNGV